MSTSTGRLAIIVGILIAASIVAGSAVPAEHSDTVPVNIQQRVDALAQQVTELKSEVSVLKSRIRQLEGAPSVKTELPPNL